MIFVDVATRESGVELRQLHFVVRARLEASAEEKVFEMVVSGYRDGEQVRFTLGGFTQDEGEGPQVYELSATCSNEFGESEESDAIPVTLQFSTGMEITR